MRNESLPWPKRGKVLDSAPGGGLHKHICIYHLWPHEEASTTCPICLATVATIGFPEHLALAHGLSLYAERKKKREEFPLDKVGCTFGKQYEARRLQWLQRMSALELQTEGAQSHQSEASAATSASGPEEVILVRRPDQSDPDDTRNSQDGSRKRSKRASEVSTCLADQR